MLFRWSAFKKSTVFRSLVAGMSPVTRGLLQSSLHEALLCCLALPSCQKLVARRRCIGNHTSQSACRWLRIAQVMPGRLAEAPQHNKHDVTGLWPYRLCCWLHKLRTWYDTLHRSEKGGVSPYLAVKKKEAPTGMEPPRNDFLSP